MKQRNRIAVVRSGMTVIDMIVAIGIFSAGMVAVTYLFARTWEANRYTIEMGQSSFAVSQGVRTMANYIRGARQGDDGSYPVKSADDNDLVIYADFDKDGVTERLHFYRDEKDVRMGITDPTGTMPKTYPVGDQTVRTIATDIVNGVDVPLFYYYEQSYAGRSDQDPLPTPATASDIRIIKVYMHINIEPMRTPDNIDMQTFIELRNLNDYDRLN